VNRQLVHEIRRRAANCSEYCRIPQFGLPLPFQIDHIVAEKHSGQSVKENPALACPHCNRYKGPNIAGIDPVTGELVRLFHPRIDIWGEHFRVEDGRLIGLTLAGRTTVEVLNMNTAERVEVRVALAAEYRPLH
jgi:hypothetical protein